MSSKLTWEFYLAVKDMSYCVICGVAHTQMHHCRPADKITEVGRIARLGNMDLLRHEINKTIPLCDAHHRAVHRGRISGYMDGAYDDGRPSRGHLAARFMPWLEVIGEPVLEVA